MLSDSSLHDDNERDCSAEDCIYHWAADKFLRSGLLDLGCDRCFPGCRQNVFTFMVERLGVSDAATARALWQEHFRVYNQSLRALRAGAGFTFDTAEYWDFIRAGASDFLKPDPAVSPWVKGRAGQTSLQL